MVNSFELKLYLKDEGSLMINENPPEIIKQRVRTAKELMNTNIQNKKRVDKMLEGNLKFWDNNMNTYEAQYAKLNSPL